MDRTGTRKLIPPGIQENPPEEFSLARRVGSELLHVNTCTAIVFGTQMLSLVMDYNINKVTMLAWRRGDRQDYYVRELYSIL